MPVAICMLLSLETEALRVDPLNEEGHWLNPHLFN
jgi:hypothetical protein